MATALSQSPPELAEISVEGWLAFMVDSWQQGEHVAIIGPTGSGKTTISHLLLDLRSYVVALAVKREDETLERFLEGPKYGRKRYKVIKKWPPVYPDARVILWLRPKELGVTNDQKERLRKALNAIYLAGGWCVFFDDAGYITGFLGMGAQLGIMLNQGRSSHLTVVVAMTQPKSIVARLPSETFKQCRHQLIFKFENVGEIKAIAEIAGIDWHLLQRMMEGLGEHDFIYKGKGKLVVVRNDLAA